MLSDLKVVATITAKPESVDAVRAGLAALAAESLHEDGNVSYELFESGSTPGTFVTIEVWQSEDALDAHLQSAHLQKALAEFGDHLQSPPAIHPLRVVR